MAQFAFEFWNRVDLLRKDLQLQDLARMAGISYKTLTNQRVEHRYPKAEDMKNIARVLGTTQEFLMTGENRDRKEERSSTLSPEAKAVEKDDRLKALVRACLRDPRLLDIISAVIESSEKTLGKQA